MMFQLRTGDPLADLLLRQREEERWFNKLPKCAECGEPICSDECFEIGGEYICPECLENNHKHWVEDIMNER